MERFFFKRNDEGQLVWYCPPQIAEIILFAWIATANKGGVEPARPQIPEREDFLENLEVEMSNDNVVGEAKRLMRADEAMWESYVETLMKVSQAPVTVATIRFEGTPDENIPTLMRWFNTLRINLKEAFDPSDVKVGEAQSADIFFTEITGETPQGTEPHNDLVTVAEMVLAQFISELCEEWVI